MKKTLLSIALLLLSATSVFAVRAKQGICQLQLVDGTIVSATLHGDENFHYYTLLDGTPLQESNEQGKYEKITDAQLQEQMTASQTIKARAAKAEGIGSIRPAYFPHTGSPKALVILVQFQDDKFKSNDPQATFNHYLNSKMGEDAPEADKEVFFQGEGNISYGSVKQYFTDMSQDKFTPQFDIVGPVTVSKETKYYGANSGGDDGRYVEMMTEACQLVDDKINFADYDSYGDGYVDLVYFIYAGYSESIGGNSSNCLWPKSGTAKNIGTFDGKRVCRFGINNELNGTPEDIVDGKCLINGIGLFCHEFSHTMGLPDLYPTTGAASTANNQSPEYWDLMDMGEYTGNGYCPTPYSPWEKSIMGWIEPTVLSNTEPSQIELEPYYKNSTALRINADDDDATKKYGEYLLLQNIVNKGWAKSLPGYGLLVWRIDYADMEYVKMGDTPNNTFGKPRVMVVPADGLVINYANTGDGAQYSEYEYWESSFNDPFPTYKEGSGTEYEVNSLTKVKLNHSTLTNRPLYNITKNEETEMVTFDYLKDYSAGTGIRGIEMSDQDNRPTEYFDLEGRKVTTPQKGHLYVTNKGKKVVL